MPGGDGTGPMGYGPRTGRAMGFCNGYNMPGYANSGFGRGFGRATMYNPRGMLRPRFMGFAPVQPAPAEQPTKEQETEMLEQEAKAIEEEQKQLNKELEEVKKRIDELKGKQ